MPQSKSEPEEIEAAENSEPEEIEASEPEEIEASDNDNDEWLFPELNNEESLPEKEICHGCQTWFQPNSGASSTSSGIQYCAKCRLQSRREHELKMTKQMNSETESETDDEEAPKKHSRSKSKSKSVQYQYASSQQGKKQGTKRKAKTGTFNFQLISHLS